jgi:hypothetical protein
MVRAYFAALTSFFLLISSSVHAEVLFEGYSKILSGDAPIGYVVSRYEFDGKKKQFISTYFIKTGKGASSASAIAFRLSVVSLGPFPVLMK